MNEDNEIKKAAKDVQPEIVKTPLNLKEVVGNLQALGNEIGRNLRQVIISLEEVAKQNAPVIAAIIENLRKMPGEFLAIQQALSERGWFVLAEMPLGDYRNLKNIIDNSKFDDLDKIMSAWTSELLDETEKKLCELFPVRETLLREGFENHRNGRYASAITLLLTQADGLCFDSLKKIFFKERQEPGGIRVTGIKTELEALGVDGLAKITLHPILIVSGINANEEQIRNGEFPNSPHRNPILHGKVTDYASKLNSLKIISLVGYMGGVAHKIVEETKSLAATPIDESATG